MDTSLKNKFGTAPVFFTAISTILGAIMFLRFGYAVGNVGLTGTILIILIGHAVTIHTAMAIAEISTNQKVEGGGEYYIISRSFGLVIGSAIGIALYLSQAISVAFYVIAFTEAFSTLFQYLIDRFSLPVWLEWIMQQKQTIGIPALLGLTYIVLTKGADLGVKALYIVVATLAVALIAFFLGHPTAAVAEQMVAQNSSTPAITVQYDAAVIDSLPLFPDHVLQDSAVPVPQDEEATISQPEERSPSPLLPISFFTIFAIIFPAFTGMTAGVGLSGDLKDPGRSIPLGTLAATISGMVIYIFIAVKLYQSATAAELADTSRLVMADIAWQGWWIIPLGLAAATISSALGSIMVAPRTLQAIARDNIFPTPRINRWLSNGKGEKDEPFNASVITILIAGVFVMAGALDNVAQIISMFFMVTYGSLCLISFLNHFAADPSYRPRFRSHWIVSLFGAIACFGLMISMNPGYAFLAVLMMVLLYFAIAYYNHDKRSLALIFQGVIFQFSRSLQVFLQKADKEQTLSWRPSAIAFSAATFERIGAFDLLRWIAQKYGFGTYIHHIEGYLSRETNEEAQESKHRLITMAERTKSKIYIDTLISPSYTSSIAQVIQLPGIAGTENNLLLFEFSKNHPEGLFEIVDNFKLITSVGFDVLVLSTSERGFGLRKQIHLWITPADFQHANLMILLSYVIIGHPEWRGAEIKIWAIFPQVSIQEEKQRLLDLIHHGQLPISSHNVNFIAQMEDMKKEDIICAQSKDADLTILGFQPDIYKHKEVGEYRLFRSIGNILYVHAVYSKEIK